VIGFLLFYCEHPSSWHTPTWNCPSYPAPQGHSALWCSTDMSPCPHTPRACPPAPPQVMYPCLPRDMFPCPLTTCSLVPKDMLSCHSKTCPLASPRRHVPQSFLPSEFGFSLHPGDPCRPSTQCMFPESRKKCGCSFRNGTQGWAPVLTPVILATLEAEIGRNSFQGQPRQMVFETPSPNNQSKMD
jgi:hypothetical protein